MDEQGAPRPTISNEFPIAISDRVKRLPVGERAELLALARRIRAELAEGPSRLRELVVELERRLDGPEFDAAKAEGA